MSSEEIEKLNSMSDDEFVAWLKIQNEKTMGDNTQKQIGYVKRSQKDRMLEYADMIERIPVPKVQDFDNIEIVDSINAQLTYISENLRKIVQYKFRES